MPMTLREAAEALLTRLDEAADWVPPYNHVARWAEREIEALREALKAETERSTWRCSRCPARLTLERLTLDVEVKP